MAWRVYGVREFHGHAVTRRFHDTNAIDLIMWFRSNVSRRWLSYPNSAGWAGIVDNVEEGMIVVTVMYPENEGATFDMDYYLSDHLKMVGERWGGMKDIEV